MSSEQEEIHLRRLKSFVLRQGRMTPGQQLAYDTLWDKYGVGKKLGDQVQTDNSDKKEVAPVKLLDFNEIFGNSHPVKLEIGFGMGDSLVEMAHDSRNNNFIGIEVHTPGVGRILQRIEEQKLSNLRIFHADAINILQTIPKNSLSAFFLYFPDPWHKRRHNKRRIVNQDFLQLIYSRLLDGGIIHMATDWQDYAKYMLSQLIKSSNGSSQLNLINQSPSNDYIDRPQWRPETKFERKGLKKGHGIWDLVFVKQCYMTTQK